MVKQLALANRQAGVSLIECITALAVLTIVSVGLVQHGQTHTTALTHGFAETCALRVAQGELERARSVPAHELVLGRSPIDFEDEATHNVPNLRGWLEVRDYDPAPTDLIEVCATVRWTPPGTTRARELQLTTLRARGRQTR